MRAFFRYCWLPFYRRWALRHIRQARRFEYAGLRLAIPPGVFHPGIFFSSPVFISFLQEIDFQGKKVLDVGTGSGILALFAARRGAVATALDINPLAVEAARRNAQDNGLQLLVLESDLFERLSPQSFDIILINPPYFARKPLDFAEHAFFAGDNLAYFERLFSQLPLAMHGSGGRSNPETQVWMILSEDCDFSKLREIAAQNGFTLRGVFEKKKWGERFFVVQATPMAA